jgi:hypothetical protein
MAEEASEVLVLTDSEGNIYALPRRVVERARVPDELKSLFRVFGSERPRAARTLAPIGPPAWRRHFPQAVSAAARPWPVGWFRVPAP